MLGTFQFHQKIELIISRAHVMKPLKNPQNWRFGELQSLLTHLHVRRMVPLDCKGIEAPALKICTDLTFMYILVKEIDLESNMSSLSRGHCQPPSFPSQLLKSHHFPRNDLLFLHP